MDANKIVIGMKVVPHSKSIDGGGPTCDILETHWQEQGFMYVNVIHKEGEKGYDWPAYYQLGKETGTHGNYYLASDFEPYIEKGEVTSMLRYAIVKSLECVADPNHLSINDTMKKLVGIKIKVEPSTKYPHTYESKETRHQFYWDESWLKFTDEVCEPKQEKIEVDCEEAKFKVGDMVECVQYDIPARPGTIAKVVVVDKDNLRMRVELPSGEVRWMLLRYWKLHESLQIKKDQLYNIIDIGPNDGWYSHKQELIGKIGTFEEAIVEPEWIAARMFQKGCYFHTFIQVKLEKVVPEEKKLIREFKKGERVVCIKNDNGYKIGEFATVYEDQEETEKLHSVGGMIVKGRITFGLRGMWWTFADCWQIVPEPKKHNHWNEDFEVEVKYIYKPNSDC